MTALTGGSSVTVKAKTQYHETTFTVTTSSESYDNGTLTIDDIEDLVVGERAEINAVFTPSGASETITYTFEGNDIEISDGYVYALVADRTVTVTATTRYHETTFTVSTVNADGIRYFDIYIIAGQSNAAGYSSKGGSLGGVFENISYAGEINAPAQRRHSRARVSYVSFR